jgi:hypothetical protein
MFWNASQQPQQVIIQQPAAQSVPYPSTQGPYQPQPQDQYQQVQQPMPQDDTNFLGLTTVGVLIGLCILGYLAYRGMKTA